MRESDYLHCKIGRVGAVYVEFDKRDSTIRDTLYFREGFDPKNLFEQSEAAHELGHYVQGYNGVFDLWRSGKTTVGAIEGEGYLFQKMWFHTKGSPEAQQAIFARASADPTAVFSRFHLSPRSE